MFKGNAQRLDVLKMCEDCRVIAVTAEKFDPYGAPQRPAPRTTEDYLRERETKGSELRTRIAGAAKCHPQCGPRASCTGDYCGFTSGVGVGFFFL